MLLKIRPLFIDSTSSYVGKKIALSVSKSTSFVDNWAQFHGPHPGMIIARTLHWNQNLNRTYLRMWSTKCCELKEYKNRYETNQLRSVSLERVTKPYLRFWTTVRAIICKRRKPGTVVTFRGVASHPKFLQECLNPLSRRTTQTNI